MFAKGQREPTLENWLAWRDDPAVSKAVRTNRRSQPSLDKDAVQEYCDLHGLQFPVYVPNADMAALARIGHVARRNNKEEVENEEEEDDSEDNS